MWELDYKESWAPKNWCFWTVVLEKTLESPLDCKEVQPVYPKGDQSWVFIGRNDVEAANPILWPPDERSWLIGKDPDAGKDWGKEETGTTEDEMVGWHHWLNGHGFGWTLEVGDGQGGLACCGSWGCKELDTTEWLNWTELKDRQICVKDSNCSDAYLGHLAFTLYILTLLYNLQYFKSFIFHQIELKDNSFFLCWSSWPVLHPKDNQSLIISYVNFLLEYSWFTMLC